MVSHTVTDPDVAQVSSRPTLFPEHIAGSRAPNNTSAVWDTSKLSSLLDALFRQEMGIGMSVRKYRQCADAIRNELIEKPIKDRQILSLQSTHSPEVADKHYAVEADQLPECPVRRTWEFLEASTRWHQFLGLVGHEAQPKPAPALPNYALNSELQHAAWSVRDPSQPVEAPVASSQIPSSATAACGPTALFSNSMSSQFPMQVETLPSVRAALQALHGPGARFKSRE